MQLFRICTSFFPISMLIHCWFTGNEYRLSPPPPPFIHYQFTGNEWLSLYYYFLYCLLVILLTVIPRPVSLLGVTVCVTTLRCSISYPQLLMLSTTTTDSVQPLLSIAQFHPFHHLLGLPPNYCSITKSPWCACPLKSTYAYSPIFSSIPRPIFINK